MFNLKASHNPVSAYYSALARFRQRGRATERNTRSAFADLLKRCATLHGCHLVEGYPSK